MQTVASRPRPRPGATFRFAVPTALSLVLALGWAGPAGAAKTHRHRPPPVVATGQPAPAPMNSASAVSCGDVEHCWAVGFGTGTTAAVSVSRDGGDTWARQFVPASVTALAGVSCTGKLDCLAVGATATAGAVIWTRDGGHTWTLGAVPAGAAAVTAVQCAPRLTCLALATDGMTYWSEVTTDLGQSWTRGGNLPAGMSASPALTCPTPGTCLVAGFAPTGPGRGAGAIAATDSDGQTWSAATVPTGIGILRGITCTGSTCLAAGTASTATTGFVPGAGQLLTSTDGGATWAPVPAGAPHDDAFAASCPNAKTCVVVGTDWVGKSQPVPKGAVIASLDAGTLWRAATLRFVPVGMAAISCPRVNTCVAVGGNVLVHIVLPVRVVVVPKHRTARPTSRVGGVR
ncbi:MAG: hypothetical protein ACRDYB_02120 [Acidimicrobiales bacterium]